VRSSKYRIYIDESGDHVFRDEVAMQDPSHRFLALAGCFFEGESYKKFHESFEALKQKHFPHNPDDPVILHRSDMINCKGPFWRLRDEARRQAFEGDLLAALEDTDFLMIAVVIDKLVQKRSYPIPWHPYNMALGFMLQRYCGYLNHIGKRGDVLAESRGKTEDRILKGAYEHIHNNGDMHHKATWFQQALTSNSVKLKQKKANISGLQLADLVAYPARQDILIERGYVEEPSEAFGRRIATVLEGKYNKHLYDGRIEGYGRVFFPK